MSAAADAERLAPVAAADVAVQADAAKPAATTTTAAPAVAPKPAAKKPADPKQAEYARERACGAEWKAEKAAGKVPEGMTWPKYWSDCDKRKKAAGM